MTMVEKISSIKGRMVLDSRGYPTVEVDIWTENGAFGRGIVPSGASTGSFEALELHDKDPALYQGKGVRKAIEHVNTEIAPCITGCNVLEQQAIDREMLALDGTANKSRLGANAILGVSLAVLHAAANFKKMPLYRYIHQLFHSEGIEDYSPTLPLPMINILSGGLHANRAVDFQDFLAIPIGARSYSESISIVSHIYFSVQQLLLERGESYLGVADEGGFGPRLSSNEEGLQLLCDAIVRAGYRPGVEAAIGLDVAATHFFDGETYALSSENRKLSSIEMVDYLCKLCSSYPIISIEDGLAEEDWNGWAILSEKLKNHVQLLGDDLFTTNIERIKHGVKKGIANAVLIKMNQIGTITETLEAIRYTKANKYLPVVSARSGETEDYTIADLAVGTAAGQLKVGSLARSERLAKWNQLFRIEEELGTHLFSAKEVFNSISKK
jgi:enolase